MIPPIRSRSGPSTVARAKEVFGPAYRKILNEVVPAELRETIREEFKLPAWMAFETYADVLAAQQVFRAICGDTDAAKEVANRTDGKPFQQVDLGWTGGPIPLVGMTLDELREREKQLEEELKALTGTVVDETAVEISE